MIGSWLTYFRGGTDVVLIPMAIVIAIVTTSLTTSGVWHDVDHRCRSARRQLRLSILYTCSSIWEHDMVVTSHFVLDVSIIAQIGGIIHTVG